MTEIPRFRITDWLLLGLIVLVAAAARVGYVALCLERIAAPTPLAVQDPPEHPAALAADKSLPAAYAELPDLFHNVKEHFWGGALAPLAKEEELTAHSAPGYAWVAGRLARLLDDPEATVTVLRWTQLLLGSLTAGLYFLFARRAFRSVAVGSVAGLLCALHPFWIINTPELDDGTLVCFLLGASLWLGTRGSEEGDATCSLLFGLALAGLALLRAALLPFAMVACLWFFLRCREVSRGWLCALLAFLGLANGLAPWTVRNAMAANVRDLVPVANSTYLHLWMGVNDKANGGPQDEGTLRASLRGRPARGSKEVDRLVQVLAEKNQSRRYSMLAHDVLAQLAADPGGVLYRRLLAGQCFVVGRLWLDEGTLARVPGEGRAPAEVVRTANSALQGSLLVMVLLGLAGWRWSYPWRRESRLAALAVFWIPLPYLLTHAAALSGPRLPLDGVLLCYTAFALLCLVPGVGEQLRREVPNTQP
ncbi:MAG: glycosyltransferase family 39 protein [Gemmataceae bacterium]|nr:glycosyltransferase family 39 protein [Gemmataceae bacterium]